MRRIANNEPEENTKCIDINRVVIAAREQLRCHVDWSANNGTRHHRFWLAETEVCDLAAILVVQLKNDIK